MLLHVVCESCGVAGRVLVADEAHLPRCPRCETRLAIAAGGGEDPENRQPGFDEDIVAWISDPPGATASHPDVEVVCRRCGWAGVLPLESDRGDSICPACLAVYRLKPPPGHRVVPCPGCGQPVEYSDLDRGKTILCPACNYFLGCLVPPEKHPYRSRRRGGIGDRLI
jgi:hypothetical protein